MRGTASMTCGSRCPFSTLHLHSRLSAELRSNFDRLVIAVRLTVGIHYLGGHMTGKSLFVSGLLALVVAASPHVSRAAPLSLQGTQFGDVDAEEMLAQRVQYRRYGACPPGWDFNYRAGRCIRWAYRDRPYGYHGRRYGACPRGWDWNGYRCVRWRY